jgi:hypothetical protein
MTENMGAQAMDEKQKEWVTDAVEAMTLLLCRISTDMKLAHLMIGTETYARCVKLFARAYGAESELDRLPALMDPDDVLKLSREGDQIVWTRLKPCSGGHRGPFEDQEWADGTIDLVCISCGAVAKEGHAFRTAEGITVEVCRQNAAGERPLPAGDKP